MQVAQHFQPEITKQSILVLTNPKFFLYTLLLCYLVAPLQAQKPEPTDSSKTFSIQYIWTQVEIGGGGAGIIGSVNINIISDITLYSLRYVRSATFWGGYYGLINVDECSILAGFFSRGNYTMLSASAGPALVLGKIGPTSWPQTSTTFTNIGLSFDLQASIKFPFTGFGLLNLPFIGLGIGTFGNLNLQKSYLGITVRLYWGKS